MKLKDITTINTGLVLFRRKAPRHSQNNLYRQITLKCFLKSTLIDSTQLEDFYPDKKLKSKYLTQESDIIIRLRAPIIAIHVDKKNQGLVTSSLMCILRVNKNIKLNPQFLAHWLNSKPTQRILKTMTKGTSIPTITTSDITNLKIHLPELEKQKTTVKLMELSYKEEDILNKILKNKKLLRKTTLNNIITGV